MRSAPAAAFGIDENVLAGMRAMGASAADIAAAEAQLQPAAPQEEAFELYAENAATLQHWLAICTQWIRAGMDGARAGLCYAGVVAYLQLCVPRRSQKAIFADLRLMERAVLIADQEMIQESKN